MKRSVVVHAAGVAAALFGCGQQGIEQDPSSLEPFDSAGAGGQAPMAASGAGGATGASNPGTGGTAGEGMNPTGIAPGTGGTSSTAAGTGGTTSVGAGGSSMLGSGGSEMVMEDELTPAVIVPELDGFLWVGACASAAGGATLNCNIRDNQGQCPNPGAANFADRGAFRTIVQNVGGEPGKQYVVNFEVRGVVGGKVYDGTLPRKTTGYTEGNTPPLNDSWQEGGTPRDSLWNTYELHVDPPVPGAVNVYYLNAFSAASGFDGRDETFAVSFTASFRVLGGGTMRFVIHDSNCLGQQNCGQTVAGQAVCSAPRSVDLTGMNPQPPSTFAQPLVQTDGLHPQWLYFDVTSISVP